MNYHYTDDSIGPIGAADRELLMAVARYYHKPRVLEFGSQYGHSARAWLDAGAELVHCVELAVTNELLDLQRQSGCMYIVQEDQRNYAPFVKSDQYDIVFLDASHDPNYNLQTIDNIRPHIAPGGCLILHDTGVWAKSCMTEDHRKFSGIEQEDGKMHQPGEVFTAGWLKASGWSVVNLASKKALRHGISICQP